VIHMYILHNNSKPHVNSRNIEFLVLNNVFLFPSLIVPPRLPGLCSGISITYTIYTYMYTNSRHTVLVQLNAEKYHYTWQSTIVALHHTHYPHIMDNYMICISDIIFIILVNKMVHYIMAWWLNTNMQYTYYVLTCIYALATLSQFTLAVH